MPSVARSLEMSPKTLANWVYRARRGQVLLKRQSLKPVQHSRSFTAFRMTLVVGEFSASLFELAFDALDYRIAANQFQRHVKRRRLRSARHGDAQRDADLAELELMGG